MAMQLFLLLCLCANMAEKGDMVMVTSRDAAPFYACSRSRWRNTAELPLCEKCTQNRKTDHQNTKIAKDDSASASSEHAESSYVVPAVMVFQP